MIARYTHPEMGAIWSEARRYETWLEVELAATDALADAGVVPADDARDAARARVASTSRASRRSSRTTQHDVIAFTTAVAERVGRGGALAALRPDLVGCARHGAGAADARRRAT